MANLKLEDYISCYYIINYILTYLCNYLLYFNRLFSNHLTLEIRKTQYIDVIQTLIFHRCL